MTSGAQTRSGRSKSGAGLIVAGAIVAGVSIVPRVMTGAKDLLVAARFGTSRDLDVFLVAFAPPTFAAAVVSGSLALAVVPAMVESAKSGSDDSKRLFQNIHALVLVTALVVVGVMAAAEPLVLPIVGGRLAAGEGSAFARLYFELLPMIPLVSLSTLYGAALNANDRLRLITLAPACTPVVIIAAVIAVSAASRATALAIGTVLGALVELVILLAALRALRFEVLPKWNGWDERTRRAVRQYAPLLGAGVVAGASPLVDQAVAARLGFGSISSLGYGNKLIALGIGFGYVPLNTILLPHLSRLVLDGNWVGVRRLMARGTMLIGAVTVSAAVIAVVWAKWIIALVFQRGAFSVEDTAMVSRVLAYGVCQVPFYLASIMPLRLLSAMGRNRTVMFITLSNTVVNVVGDLALARWIGLPGVALSSTVVCAWSCAWAFASVGYQAESLRRPR